MRVSKWGNSLAIRLPGSVVQALELKEGDEVEVHVAESGLLTLRETAAVSVRWSASARFAKSCLPTGSSIARRRAPGESDGGRVPGRQYFGLCLYHPSARSRRAGFARTRR